MRVIELLRQFEALPPVERKKFLRAVLSSGTRSARAQRPTRRVNWPDIESRAKRITGDRLLPNLVLAEREETSR